MSRNKFGRRTRAELLEAAAELRVVVEPEATKKEIMDVVYPGILLPYPCFSCTIIYIYNRISEDHGPWSVIGCGAHTPSSVWCLVSCILFSIFVA